MGVNGETSFPLPAFDLEARLVGKGPRQGFTVSKILILPSFSPALPQRI
jgi:hypothetical protein